MRSSRLLRGLVAALVISGAVALTGAAAPTPGPTPPAPSTPTPSPTPTRPPPPTPDDPADPTRAREYWLDGSGIREAWYTSRGKDVTIAIIDTGVGRGPTFDEAVIGGMDASGYGSPDGRTPVGKPEDRDHGSWVASLAAGRGNPDGTGMAGVAPEANILSVSIGFYPYDDKVPFDEQVATGITWAVDNGADIINLSLTTNTTDWPPAWDEAFLYAYAHDVVVVVAAGNRQSGTYVVGAPATIPGTLVVGGVDQNGIASHDASTQGITIGVSAPSEGLLGVTSAGEVTGWQGTSGAAPIVSGVAALIRSQYPDLDAANVINRIEKTAQPVTSAAGKRDPLYGYGLLQADAALTEKVAKATGSTPKEELEEWIRLNRRAEAPEAEEPEVTPVEVPPLPPADTPTEAGSPLLPSRDSLRYGTLPLIMVTVPAILISLGATAAARRIRLARESREPAP